MRWTSLTSLLFLASLTACGRDGALGIHAFPPTKNTADTTSAPPTPSPPTKTKAYPKPLAYLASGATAAAIGWQPRSFASIHLMLRSDEDRLVRIAIEQRLARVTDLEAGEQEALIFLQGRLAVEARDPAALAILDQLPIPTQHINERRLIWLARAENLAGERERSLASIEALFQTTVSFPEHDEMVFLQAQHLQALGREEEARAALSQLADADRAWRARVLKLKADWETDPEKRLRYHKTLLTNYPEQPPSQEPLELSVDDLTPGEQLQRARRLIRGWHYADARSRLPALFDHAEFGLEARFLHALIDSTYLGDDYASARLHFEHLINASFREEESLYNLVEATLADGDAKAASSWAEAYLERFPEGADYGRVRFLAAAIPFYARDCTAAEVALTAYLQRYPDTVARGMLAWCSIRQEQWVEAIDAYAPLLDLRNPLVRGKALYWQAFARVQMGDPQSALEQLEILHKDYPLTYYDALGYQLSATLQPGGDPSLASMPEFENAGRAAELELDTTAVWGLPGLRGTLRQKLKRVRRLVEIGERASARRVYKTIRADVEQGVSGADLTRFQLLMSHALDEYYHGWKTHGTSTRAHSDTLPDPAVLGWQLIYPRAFAPLIERVAAKHSVPWMLLEAVMLQKSRFRLHQRSSKDALGAFQIRAPVARLLAAELGHAFDPERFDDPDHTFELSALRLKHLIDEFDGQLLLAVAAEQKSPAAIRLWIQQPRPDFALAFAVEELADSTTYNYTRKVAEFSLRYIYLYENDSERRATVLDALFPPPPDY